MYQKNKLPTFLKWAGGKKKLLDKIDSKFNGYVERYFEPFLGGGSVFFHVKQKHNPRFCMISDINKDLIEAYKAVRDNPEKLINHLEEFKEKNSRDFFYEVRDKFNVNNIKNIRRSAAFIYLNKTCFNGLWRVNSKGKFNVPYNFSKNPEIFTKDTIFSASELLQGVKIRLQDYRRIKNIIKEGDTLYLDPCYDPLKKTSFVNYNPKRFCPRDRIELAKFIRYAMSKGARIILSNNDIKEIRELYSGFNITEIYSCRSINSNPSGRGKIPELLISST